MKNQNDLIFSIVFGVLAFVALGIAIATKPEPTPIPAPPTVVTESAKLPATAVVYGAALPNGGTGGGGGGGGVRGFGGGRPAFAGGGGPPSGFAGGGRPSGPSRMSGAAGG